MGVVRFSAPRKTLTLALTSDGEDEEISSIENQKQQQKKKKETEREGGIFASCSFSDLGIHPTLSEQLRERLGFEVPTLIQAESIPIIISGRHVLINAATGTGKTIAYLAPIIHHLQLYVPRIQRSDGTFALVLVPTRELCMQVYEILQKLLHRFHWIVPGYIMGGENRSKEKARLRKGISILVATPGRLLDHLKNTSSFAYANLRWIIFDEADRILELGFGKEIEGILTLLGSRQSGSVSVEAVPRPTEFQRQNLLLSATLNDKVNHLAKISLENPVMIGLDDKRISAELPTPSGGYLGTIASDGNRESIYSDALPSCSVEDYNLPVQLVQRYVKVSCGSRLVVLLSILRSLFEREVHQKRDENGHQDEEEIKTKELAPSQIPLSKQKSLTDRQQENHDALIKCLAEDKRFDKNRPAAACIVYKSLLQWRSFEADKTNIFDRIIHTIRISIENQENVSDLAYWLSTTSTLLFLLQNTLKASHASSQTSHRSRTPPVTLFGRMAQGYRSSASGIGISSGYSGMVGKPDIQSRVEAKYPALLFKQHLTAYVEKIYGMIRDSLKKEISPFLNMCIQAPRSARVRSIRASSKSIHSNVVAKQASSIHWQSIVQSLDRTLGVMCENYVPSMIIRKTFSQVFSFINVQLFNSLLLRRECCSFSNGEYVKAGLQELEQWCFKATDQFAGTSWDELRHIRQAVGFLVLHQKAQKSLDEIANELCPVLSVPQIYRIGTMFWDDKYGTQGLSPDVISKMRALMTEDSVNTSNNSFLLDDDSSIPFSLDDISRSVLDISLSDVDPPPLLRQNSEFHFLLQRAD